VKKLKPPEASPGLADQSARDRIRKALDATLIVEAAAGTGKTTELVERIIAGITSGRMRLATILALTFTDTAAGELKLRLRTAIEQARQRVDCPEKEKALLVEALGELEEARIGTIHSFCADVLREHPIEAGIDPLFQVAPDDMARPLFNIAFDRWFEKQIANPGEAVRRILRRPARQGWGTGSSAGGFGRSREVGPRKMLRTAAWKLVKERDFDSPWRRFDEFDRTARIDSLLLEMKELGQWAEQGDPKWQLTKSLLAVKLFVTEVTRMEEVTDRDYDAVEGQLFEFLRSWKSKNYVAYFSDDGFPKEELIRRRDELREGIAEFIRDAGAHLAPLLRDEIWPTISEYEHRKERAGYLDFLDLLIRVRNLVQTNESIRASLQQRIERIFVDEFQDTDPLQAEILMLLAADDPKETDWRQVVLVAGKLFIVGDPKQSIFRFRRADVKLYDEVKQRILGCGGDLVELTVSFRSLPEIQTAINSAFALAMNVASPTQARYVPLAPFRPSISTQPTLIALPIPQPYFDYGNRSAITNKQIDISQPVAVAAFIDWLLAKSGWTVTERGQKEPIPVEARHICLLFKRFRGFLSDVTRPYVAALETRRLPHLLIGGSSLHNREETEAIRNALTAIEWPDDELAVFATLKGPFFALSDSQLLAYKSLHSSFHPYRDAAADLPSSIKEVADVLSILRDLHRMRNYRPIAETIARLLSLTRAHAGIATWPNGEQALANLMRLSDMARRAERNGLISFRAFVDWLEDQAESGEVGDAPILEEGVDGIRIMTIHKAKGLEFPIVILPDITAKDTRTPSHWTDQANRLCAMELAGCVPREIPEHADEEIRLEEEEAARLLYVAATRARDLLVVCAIGDKPYDGWLSTLNPVLYPEVDASFQPATRQPPGCPEFGMDNVIARASNCFRPPGSVSPGLHSPRMGAHDVVWWDPALLDLEVQRPGGSRLTSLLTADVEGNRAKVGMLNHTQWQKQRTKVREIGGRPEWTIVTAGGNPSEIARDLAIDNGTPCSRIWSRLPDVTIESVEEVVGRPHGPRFGTLVHTVLSVISLDSSPVIVQAVTSTQGRVFGATPEEVSTATETIVRTLRHPLLRKAAQAELSGNCRREVPVTAKVKEGVVVEGVVDLAYEDSGVWIVVDYKTGFEIESMLGAYRTQVRLYALAISLATGRDARPVLLKV
jgi:ATP-dependent helicase/nuclease subunit A